MLKTEKLKLVSEWDKTFPQSEKVDHKKVTFVNRYGITLAADLYKPKNASGKYPAIAVSGPFGAVKEQCSGLYAQTMAERGYLTIVFDPSFTGESGGYPRFMASPDINTEDFMAAVDFLSVREDVDLDKIGIIGICGWGGMALNAAALDTRIKATVAGPDGAFVYKFITTDEYKKLRLHIYRYESGKLSDQDKVEMGFEDIGSPKSGEIVMVPDFDTYVIKLIISGGGSRLSTEIPVLENVENREYYGRTATEIKNVVDIRYDKQQPLIAFVYDNDEMSVPTLDDFINSQTDFLSKNDYVYYVAFEFCK